MESKNLWPDRDFDTKWVRSSFSSRELKRTNRKRLLLLNQEFIETFKISRYQEEARQHKEGPLDLKRNFKKG